MEDIEAEYAEIADERKSGVLASSHFNFLAF